MVGGGAGGLIGRARPGKQKTLPPFGGQGWIRRSGLGGLVSHRITTLQEETIAHGDVLENAAGFLHARKDRLPAFVSRKFERDGGVRKSSFVGRGEGVRGRAGGRDDRRVRRRQAGSGIRGAEEKSAVAHGQTQNIFLIVCLSSAASAIRCQSETSEVLHAFAVRMTVWRRRRAPHLQVRVAHRRWWGMPPFREPRIGHGGGSRVEAAV